MTVRAAVLGILLGLTLSATTYFNDWIIGQTSLLGNQLPISIFGVALLVLLLTNPLLGALKPSLALHGRELLVAVAVSLACFAWPGASFYRWFVKLTALPAHWEHTRPHWQANGVMSYVPGGSPEIAAGQVRDWPEFARVVCRAGHDPNETPARRVWSAMTADTRARFEQATASNSTSDDVTGLVRGLNQVLTSQELYSRSAFSAIHLDDATVSLLRERAHLPTPDLVRLNHALLAAAYPSLVLASPAGGGWLVANGRADPRVVDPLIQGRASDSLSLRQLPWRAWAPTLRLWGELAMLLGLMAVCLALIVHPQWSKNELLSYPVARFLEEVTAGTEGSRWPLVFRTRLFWVCFIVVVLWHAVNGAHAWFPAIPEIPRRLDFGGLRELFPNAARLWYADAYFAPTLYLTVVAFAFFLPTQISLSLGVSQLLFVALGAALMANGTSFETDAMEPTKVTMLRFGSFLGAASMIAYTGRRYYAGVLSSAMFVATDPSIPRSATWAARGLAGSAAFAVLLMSRAGLSPIFAGLFVGMALLSFVVLARVVAETGAFHMNAAWLPVATTMGLFGFDAIGPTPFIVLALASSLLLHDQREALMGALCNAFQMSERGAGVTPVRLMPAMIVLLLAGFFVAGAATLYLSYNYGAIAHDTWGGEIFPTIPFDRFAHHLREAQSYGTLSDLTAASGLGHLGRARFDATSYGWLCIGLVAVLCVAAARLRFAWWPLHPVIFLVWGTWEITNFAFSFLLGWMIKFAIVHTTGARGYHAVKPLMVGVIAGELIMGLFWIAVGALHFLISHQPPPAYSIFPR